MRAEKDLEFSIIVPLHRDNPRFRASLERCQVVALRGSGELVIVSDRPVPNLPDDVVTAVTWSSQDTPPGVKRDLGIKCARGKMLAFIDDDAYPREDWLDHALRILRDDNICGVGGPGITPPNSPWREQLGGAVYESFLGSGPLRFRFSCVGERRALADLPAFNLVIKREVLEEIGGWNSMYYGGEDTKLCETLAAVNKSLVYDPEVVVYHFRRPIFRGHLRQVGNVGLHRGYFFRSYPLTSRRPIYLLPLLGTLALGSVVAGAMPLALEFPARFFSVVFVLWLSVSLGAIKKVGVAGILFPITLLAHHAVYGYNFLRGVLSKELLR